MPLNIVCWAPHILATSLFGIPPTVSYLGRKRESGKGAKIINHESSGDDATRPANLIFEGRVIIINNLLPPIVGLISDLDLYRAAVRYVAHCTNKFGQTYQVTLNHLQYTNSNLFTRQIASYCYATPSNRIYTEMSSSSQQPVNLSYSRHK